MPTKHSPSIHQSDGVKVRQNLTSDDLLQSRMTRNRKKQNDLIMHGLLDVALMSKSGKSTMRLITYILSEAAEGRALASFMGLTLS